MSRRQPLPRDAFRVWYPVTVRWGDMDSYAHVNNAVYLTYCESARFAYFERVRLFDDDEDGRFGPVVVEVRCAFLAQVRHPASLDVGATAVRLGRSSFTLAYGLFRRGTDELVAEGDSVVVWIDRRAERSAPLPEPIVARIRALDGRTLDRP